jgi:hypothetical protein
MPYNNSNNFVRYYMRHCSVVSFFVLVLALAPGRVVIVATGNYKGNSGVQYSAANYFFVNSIR